MKNSIFTRLINWLDGQISSVEPSLSVDEVIQGIENIERMREEIDDLIRRLFDRLVKSGALPEFPRDDGSHISFFSIDGKAEWRLWILNNRYKVSCTLNLDANRPRVALNTYADTPHINIRFDEVEGVYDRLQMLLDGILDRFPELRQDVPTIRSAALKFS